MNGNLFFVLLLYSLIYLFKKKISSKFRSSGSSTISLLPKETPHTHSSKTKTQPFEVCE
jgi:hypothetical protein